MGLALTAALVLAGCGGGGSQASSTAGAGADPPAAADPTLSLNAAPLVVNSGETTTLTWQATNATACTASGNWSGQVATGGSKSVGPVTANSSYALACSGPSGKSATASVSVNVRPTASLSVDTSSVPFKGSAHLTWSSTNATACAASGGWSGSLPPSGTQSTGALTDTTSFSLVCSGAGGTSNSATATVSVQAGIAITVSPSLAMLTLRQPQQFNVPAGASAAWSVDGISGGNGTVGLISSTGLYTPGSAPGAHTIVAASPVDASNSARATAIVTDLAGVFTYHNDNSRDGANTREYALTPASVNNAHFGKLFSCTTDGAIYTQPLWVPSLTLGGSMHNVVFVATEHDSLYAFDADASPCEPLWSVSLIDAAHGANAGETTVPDGPTGNLVGVGDADISPEVGVTGTPVIDPVTGILYVVSKSVGANRTSFYERLHAIDILTGREEPGSPVLIAGSVPGSGDGGTTVAFDSKRENQRAGLALVNGVVYIAWGSHEDAIPFHGWMMGYTYNGSSFQQTALFNATPNGYKGGIWMGGGAPASDETNNLYAVTGDGLFDADTLGQNDYADSVLQLSSGLRVLQYFTPSDQANDAAHDLDFGSGGTALLADLPGEPVTHLLIGGGKDGSLYVLNRDNLGGYGDPAAVQVLSGLRSLFATPAYWNQKLFIAGAGGPLTAFTLNPAVPSFSSAGATTHNFGFPGSTPSISAQGNSGGIVWALDNSQYCTPRSAGCGPAVLYAYDATDVSSALWSSATDGDDAAGNAVKFSVPTIANGRVYLGTRGNNIGGLSGSTSIAGELDVYGLTSQ